MKTHDKIIQASIELALQRPADQISYAEIAARAGVHWTTVRRHLGSREKMRELLAQEQQDRGLTNADTRTRVLDAALQVFSRQGYAGSTLDQVGGEAGLTKGAVYWHFSNKTDLYLAICERNLKHQAQFIPQQAQAILQSENPEQALAVWLKSQVIECMAAPGRPMLFFEFFTASRDEVIREKMRELFEVFYGSACNMFQSFQEQGFLRKDVDPQSLAVFIQTVLNGLLLSWLMSPKTLELESFALDAAKLLWRGWSPER